MTIPVGIIPFSLLTFIVPLAVSLISRRNGVLLVVAYLLIGGIGFPVFANWQAGWAVFAGPTGGYLIGLLVFPWLISGWEKDKNVWLSLTIRLLGSGILQLVVGALWLGQVLNLPVNNTFMVGVMPFVVVMILKTVSMVFVVQLLSNKSILKSVLSMITG